MILAARLNDPMLATTWRNILYFSVSNDMRRELGVRGAPPDRFDQKALLARYKNVRMRFHGILQFVDPSPFPKNRRLRSAEFDDEVSRRLALVTADERELRYERLQWLMEAILEASFRAMPRRLRRRWKGSVAVDGTPIPAWARPQRRSRGSGRNVEVHSADPDAGWYVRDPDQRDSDKPWIAAKDTRKESRWCHEATFVVMAKEGTDSNHEYPYLIIGMPPLDKPGRDPGPNAIRALSSVIRRGHPAGFLTGDRLFPNSRPEKYQLPASALGYRHIFDYRVDQLGRQGSYAGAVQVDGDFYCPSIPEAMVTATADFRAGIITEEVWQQRVAARNAYRFRRKAHPDSEGHTRWLCPASDGAPTARCELKPRSINPRTAGKTRIDVVPEVKEARPRCCRQQTITVPPEAGAKFRQALPHGAPDWTARYASARSTNEGVNGVTKDDAFEALKAPGRRRIRGTAAQSVITVLLVFATNIRLIESFIELAVVRPDGTLSRPTVRRRSTAPLSDWNPLDEQVTHETGPPNRDSSPA